MAQVTFFGGEGKTHHVTIKEGHTILRAARQGHVPLRHKCGGKASCTTCKVRIDDQTGASSPNQKEIYKLGERNIQQGMRLSCQTKVFGQIEANIPEDPYRARIRQLLQQQADER